MLTENKLYGLLLFLALALVPFAEGTGIFLLILCGCYLTYKMLKNVLQDAPYR